jgi:hypothetical protein
MRWDGVGVAFSPPPAGISFYPHPASSSADPTTLGPASHSPSPVPSASAPTVRLVLRTKPPNPPEPSVHPKSPKLAVRCTTTTRVCVPSR